MKTLIAEDDLTSRTLLQELLLEYGPSDAVSNGRKAVDSVEVSLRQQQPYDLICIDIIMPEMDGQQALEAIRALEAAEGTPAGHGAKIVMTTGSRDKADIIKAFQGQCDAYLLKPVGKASLMECLQKLELLSLPP